MSDRTAEVLRLATPPARRLLPGVLLGALGGLCAVALLACSAWLITKAAEQPALMYLSAAIVGVRAFALFRAAFRYAERLAAHDAAFRQLGRLRALLVERLIPLAPAGLAGLHRGDLLARFSRDVDALQDRPLRVLQPVVVAVTVATAAVVAVAWFSPGAALVLAACLVVTVLAGLALHAMLSARADRAIAPLRGRLGGQLLELVGSLEVLVAFDAADAELDGIRRTDAALRRAESRAAAGAGLASALLSLGAGGATFGALLVGVPAVAAGALDGPALALVALVPLAVFEVCAPLPLVVGAARTVRASADRVAVAVPEPPAEAILEPEPERVEPPAGPAPLIELDGLAARWPGGPGVGPVSLRIEPGERVLLSGPSGSGKSTLASALARLIAHDGSYLLDGTPADRIPLSRFRGMVGLCEQTPWLFDNDIRQNLLFARDTATDAELWDVLDRVGLREWAERRGGLGARVGERGALVSGGQAQRLSLARALLAEVPVLILDEPTAGIDPERAEAVLTALMTASAGRTVLLISHVGAPAGLVDREIALTRTLES